MNGDVDLARQHGVALGVELALPGKLLQQRSGFRGPQVLGQVGKHMRCLQAQTAQALLVLRKSLAQIQMLNL